MRWETYFKTFERKSDCSNSLEARRETIMASNFDIIIITPFSVVIVSIRF